MPNINNDVIKRSDKHLRDMESDQSGKYIQNYLEKEISPAQLQVLWETIADMKFQENYVGTIATKFIQELNEIDTAMTFLESTSKALKIGFNYQFAMCYFNGTTCNFEFQQFRDDVKTAKLMREVLAKAASMNMG